MLKRTMKTCIPMALCAAMLCSAPFTVGAAENNVQLPTIAASLEKQQKEASTVRVYGSLTKKDNGQIALENSNDKDPYQKIVLNVSEDTLILDAVKGTPVPLSELKDGQTIYAYTGKAMTASLPPMSNAELILCNIPADFGVPGYFEIQSASPSEDGLTTVLATDRDTDVKVDGDTELTPFLTKNIVTSRDLVPGTRILVWNKAVMGGESSKPSAASKIMLFPYEYRGYFQTSKDGGLIVNGRPLALSEELLVYRNADGALMLPLRMACEALELAVTWDESRMTAVVSERDKLVLEASAAEASAAPGESGKPAATVRSELRNGSTFVSASDLERLLNLVIVE